jgi:DNA invertase Pin-like site-specific DNA recombinase
MSGMASRAFQEAAVMIKTCIYLRKSREDEKMERELGKGETLSKHRKDLLGFARIRNLTIVKIYEELVSGESLLYRPAMLELLKDVQNGFYNAVLVMDLQRLGRGDMEEQGIILKAFKNTSTKIITPDKEYDLSNEFDEEYSEFEAFMSRKEYKMINKRLQRGVLRSVQSGNYNSPYAPYGYVIKEEKLGRTLTPHPEQSEIVKNIFDWYINEAAGSQIIANRLNSMGLTTNRNNKWTCQAVAGLIKNPLYTGRISWGKTLNYRTSLKKGANRKIPEEKWILSEGKHPALISDEIFEKAKAIMNNRNKSPVKPSKNLSNALAGMVFCGVCGAKMHYRPYSGSAAHLICVNKCGNKSSRYDYIEEKILIALQKYLEEYNFCITEILEKPSSHISALKNSISLLEKRLKEAHGQSENVFSLLEKGIYTPDIFQKRSYAISQKIELLNNSITETSNMYKKALNQQNETVDFTPRISKIISEYYNLKTANEKNLLLKSILNKVEYIKNKDCKNDNFKIRIYPQI